MLSVLGGDDMQAFEGFLWELILIQPLLLGDCHLEWLSRQPRLYLKSTDIRNVSFASKMSRTVLFLWLQREHKCVCSFTMGCYRDQIGQSGAACVMTVWLCKTETPKWHSECMMCLQVFTFMPSVHHQQENAPEKLGSLL